MHGPIRSHLPTLRNPNIENGPLALSAPTGPSGPRVLNHPHHPHGFVVGDLAKYDVLVVQERGGRARDEELAPVGVGARVGHGQQARGGMFVLEGLVGEGGVVVNARAAGTVGVQEVAALDHEVLDLDRGWWVSLGPLRG